MQSVNRMAAGTTTGGAGHGTARVGGRQCSRTGCSELATVTLTYHYGRSQVWLDDLSVDRDPHAYDMCERHAGRLSVPTGWMLDDRRALHQPLIAV